MKDYVKDILGDNFENTIIDLNPDYDGKPVATLIRSKTQLDSTQAVLYIHGYNDYFFQKEMAEKFNKEGFNFYAVDLRRYGRSFQKHERFNDVRDIDSYFEEIEKALQIIKGEGNLFVALLGHSTGGLIVTLFAEKYTSTGLFDKVMLNSPFFEFNLSKFQKAFVPFLAFVGGLFPSLSISGGFTCEYGKSIHISGYGEWDYNLNLKPHLPPLISLGWLRAIHSAHQRMNKEINIEESVLVLHSDNSVSDTLSKEAMLHGDSILNVADIKNKAQNIKNKVTIQEIKNGLHDLVLSNKEVRKQVYEVIFDWIKNTN